MPLNRSSGRLVFCTPNRSISSTKGCHRYHVTSTARTEEAPGIWSQSTELSRLHPWTWHYRPEAFKAILLRRRSFYSTLPSSGKTCLGCGLSINQVRIAILFVLGFDWHIHSEWIVGMNLLSLMDATLSWLVPFWVVWGKFVLLLKFLAKQLY